MEQSKYGDMLLAPDYDVADSYFTLTEKTVAFMQWATSPAFQERLGQVRVDFLIMSDDDVYVDLRELAAMMAFAEIPRHRYYAGEVRSTHCDTRNTSLKHHHHDIDKEIPYISFDKYCKSVYMY